MRELARFASVSLGAAALSANAQEAIPMELAKGRRACDNDGTSWRWRPVQGCYVSVRKAITVRVIWNRPSMAGNFQFWFGEMELAQMSVTGFGTS